VRKLLLATQEDERIRRLHLSSVIVLPYTASPG
jgi:hypothetical protein